MKKNLAAVFIVCLLLGIGILYRPDAADAGVGHSPGAQKIKPQTNALQLPFIANEGQIDSKVKYYARTFNGSLFVTQDGELVYSFAKPQSTDTPKTASEYSVMRERFIGNNKEPSFKGEGEGTKVSIYKGKDPAKWQKNIPSYEQISMGDIYQGIELKLKAYGDTIEKIFSVKPGADPKAIRSRLEGAKNIQVNDKGELEIQTDIGTAVFSKPVAYQAKGQGDNGKGQKEYVQVAYVVEANQYGFIVGDYDKTRELVIDPYVGIKIQGSAEDRAYAGITFHDEDGRHIVVAGYSYSENFPFNYVFGGSGTSDSDVFVAKLTEDLGTMEQIVFIAGTGDDFGWSLAIDSENNIYVAGTTTSSDLPIPVETSPYNDSFSGGTDVFVARLSYDLSSLIALTYLGGSSLDAVNADSLAIDWYDLYVTGYTTSNSFPTPDSYAYDTSHNGGEDVFIAIFNTGLEGEPFTPGLEILKSTTFIGGSGNERPYAMAMRAGNSEVYVAGYTSSSTVPPSIGYPTTAGAFDTDYNGGTNDAFISRIMPSISPDISPLGVLASSTFLGGSVTGTVDEIHGLSVDITGYAYVTGNTNSPDFPGTCTQGDCGGMDVFIARFGDTLTSSPEPIFIKLGGTSSDYAKSLILSEGMVFVSGVTYSDDFPTNAFDTTFGGTHGVNSDGFVLRYDSSLVNFDASTYLGGSADDFAPALAADTAGDIYVAGSTNSADFPTTLTSYGSSGGFEAYVVQLDDMLQGVPCIYTISPEGNTFPAAGGSFSFSITTSAGCTWDALTEDSWISTSSSGSGSGVVHFTVSSNADRVRQGMIAVAGKHFIVTQNGPGLSLTDPSTGQQYQRFDELLDRNGAQSRCQSLGGHLATITSSLEQTFVYGNLVSGGTNGMHDCWIGGIQSLCTQEPECGWQWVTGETWGYDNWGEFEPNNAFVNENSIVMLTSDGTWNDFPETALQSFICEWDAPSHYTLTVIKMGTGSGAVRSSESPSPVIDCCSGCAEPTCIALYPTNAPVTLIAIPDTSSTFGGWLGDCTGSGQCSLTMDEDRYAGAFFILKTYAVSTAKNQGGNISPGSATVAHGDTADFMIIPQTGYHIESVSGCGGGFTDNPLLYRTGPITSNCTVSAVFVLNTYTVSTAITGGGTINPNSRVVENGSTTQFTLAPFNGYHIGSVTGCGGTLAGNTYTTGLVTGPCTVSAIFEINTYTVTASAGTGGGISPSGATTVNHGATPAFTVTPNAGYHIAGVNGTCGGSLNGTTYTTNSVTGNCTVQASFAINTYTVTASAGTGGGISPSGATTVNHGATPAFTVTPNAGYHIAGVNGTCGGSLNGTAYTTNSVTGNCTVQASFAINTYTVTASAGTGGGISPSGATTVNHGATPAFTVTPNAGYHIAGVNGTCGGSLNGNTYTTNPVTGNCTVQASFAINEYTVSALAGPGGGISPTAATVVHHGETVQFTIIPDPGYHLLSAVGCDGSLSQSSLKAAAKKKKKGKVKVLSSILYTTGQITETCTVNATFEINTYTVNAEAGEGGSISPSHATVSHGNTAQLTVTPYTGYHVKAVTGCGGTLAEGIYTTGAMTESCTVSASFEINEYTVSTAAGQGGGMAPANAQVTHGNTAQFAITPDAGYHILSVSGCEGAVVERSLKAAAKKKKKNKRTQSLTGSTYTTGPITGDCTVTAIFEIDAYTVTADAGPGGNIDPSGATTVNYGATPAFTVTPNQGYHITSMSGTCGGSLIGSTYTTNPATESCTVHAEFEINEYTVSTSAGQGGGIAPASAKVNHGETAHFTVTPDTNYHIVSVTGCGGILNGNTYTTGQITEHCTVTASFAMNTYAVTILKSGSGDGAILAQGLTCEDNACSGEYVHGTKVIFKVEPESGFRVADVRIDGVSIGAMNTFTFKRLTGNHTIEIIFAPL